MLSCICTYRFRPHFITATLRRTIPCDQTIFKVFGRQYQRSSRTISIDRLKPCFSADPDPAKPTSVDKSSTTSTSSSTVPATPHHSQQGTSEQSSKLRVRFAEPPAQYVTRSGQCTHLDDSCNWWGSTVAV
ncbi:hypothetical protein TNIN_450141 [Trichonephila inaurata madagascariensis]|uniref:Uncharacterized protein n=1 Tax=Trichonephila inaurata madagascariensis TaxID=2747483 RepID=A0A8X6WP90_9ARAC|nr:hypothetical protein TNIN_450141 [Trichonephila inaurata madagascariensis]